MSPAQPPNAPPAISEDDEAVHLVGLPERFLAALEARRRGDVDSAAELLRGILRAEPRLSEPHLELSSILLETGQLEEAEQHAEEAIRMLETGEPWTDEVPADTLRSLAWNYLGEALRRRADSDEVVFGDPAVFATLMGRARSAFAKSAALDPTNAHADHWSFNLHAGAQEQADEAADLPEFDPLLGPGGEA